MSVVLFHDVVQAQAHEAGRAHHPPVCEQVLRRYFTPASAARAEAALVQVVTGRNAAGALTPVATGSPGARPLRLHTPQRSPVGQRLRLLPACVDTVDGKAEHLSLAQAAGLLGQHRGGSAALTN